MTIISAQENGIYGKATYVAVPSRPSLTEILDSDPEFRQITFPMGHSPKNIEAVKAIVYSGDNLGEVTMTFSNNPFFDPRIYRLPTRSLEGLTTFHVAAISQSEQTTEDMINKVLGLFPQVLDLEMRPDMNSMMSANFPIILESSRAYFQFCETHRKLATILAGGRDLPYKSMQKGFFIDIVRMNLKKIGIHDFPSNDTVELVKRIEGNSNRTPVELSLVYMNGPRTNPGIYGVTAHIRFEKGCPAWEINQCDQARSFVGYLISPNMLFYGGTRLMKEKSENVYGDMPGLGHEMNFCTKVIGSVQIPSRWNEVEKEIEKLDHHLSKEHMTQIMQLTKWFYENSL